MPKNSFDIIFKSIISKASKIQLQIFGYNFCKKSR